MVRGASRRGFTLVELMVTSAISAVILGAVVSSFVGGIRLLKATFATAEMSLRSRDLRDRLLFHAEQPHNDTAYGGLLASTNLVDRVTGKDKPVLDLSENKIQLGGVGLSGNNENLSAKAELFELRIQGNGFAYYNASLDKRWLNPGGLNLFADSRNTPPLTWAQTFDGEKSRFYIHLTGRLDVSGLSVEHNERIVVPVFGKKQETCSDGKGGLDK